MLKAPSRAVVPIAWLRRRSSQPIHELAVLGISLGFLAALNILHAFTGLFNARAFWHVAVKQAAHLRLKRLHFCFVHDRNLNAGLSGSVTLVLP